MYTINLQRLLFLFLLFHANFLFHWYYVAINVCKAPCRPRLSSCVKVKQILMASNENRKDGKIEKELHFTSVYGFISSMYNFRFFSPSPFLSSIFINHCLSKKFFKSNWMNVCWQSLRYKLRHCRVETNGIAYIWDNRWDTNATSKKQKEWKNK